MGRIFNQKGWLEELDETGPEKRRKASNFKCNTEQNYWITDAAQKLPH